MADWYQGMREGDTGLGPRNGGGRAFPRGPRPSIARTAAQRQAFRRSHAGRVEALVSAAPAPSTNRVKVSHYLYWEDFCELAGIDVDAFATGVQPSHQTRLCEEDALTGLLVFAVEYPRARYKRRAAGGPQGRNTVGYAADVVSSVRLWYEARRGGDVGVRCPGGANSVRYRAVRKALAKIQPQARAPRQPILPQHMRALHGTVVLDAHEDRTYWCLAISCWVGVTRVGDWLPDDTERVWVDARDVADPGPVDVGGESFLPSRRSHRARITVEVDPKGDEIDVMTVAMKPSKDDPLGVSPARIVFSTGPSTEVLNPGNAWREMLIRDPSPKAQDERTPIFRQLPSGREISKTGFKRWCDRKFREAGLPQFGMATHSFRIGGATTLAELAGEDAARGMGGWRSSAMLRYIHMSDERKLSLGAAMVRSPALKFGTQSQPASRRR